MQENSSQNANLILTKLKKALKINTDIQLSEFLNIKPNTISSWKKRNTLDYTSIISICELYEIDLNEIFLGQESRKESYGEYALETPLICREVQFQYCLGNESLLESVPKYHFPFIQGVNTRAFQVLTNNMAPIVSENSFAVCEAGNIDTVEDHKLVVVISRSKGFFINRISRSSEAQSTYILSSENPTFNPIQINHSEINEIWIVKGIMSYNIGHEQKAPAAYKEAHKKK
jgi:hypothetical protein